MLGISAALHLAIVLALTGVLGQLRRGLCERYPCRGGRCSIFRWLRVQAERCATEKAGDCGGQNKRFCGVRHERNLSIGWATYFGSSQALDREHLKRLKELTKRTKTPWLSDHLCWGSVDGRYTHDLLPLPYTFEAVRTTTARIREVQDYLEIPIAVENVSSYLEFHESQMTEWEFLNEVVHAADCGILLDVNNIYVSSENHNFDPMKYVNAVVADRVAKIHIAGHSKFEKYTLDTHDHPVLDPVWGMYERAIARVGVTATLLSGMRIFLPSTRFMRRR
jgi:uncharacterized protein (UPF0276 family)